MAFRSRGAASCHAPEADQQRGTKRRILPDAWRSSTGTTRTSTHGEFGGLGIVISIRDGMLTVIRPMPGTPADRAGLHRMDRIVRIGEESTMNMPLEEAVDRLRGPPGSDVIVWITREGDGGWEEPREFTLTRAVIHIESVESRMLGGGSIRTEYV